MTIKRLDRKGQWGIEAKKRYFHREFSNDDFTGVIALLYFDNVREARIWKYPDQMITVCDKGMKWLQFIPSNENYAVKAMISKDNVINLWYIDVIAGYGYTDDNVIYINDLYIDIILRPDGDYITDDTNDELNEALAENIITKEMHAMALNTKEKLLKGLVSDVGTLNRFCMKYLNKMENICN